MYSTVYIFSFPILQRWETQAGPVLRQPPRLRMISRLRDSISDSHVSQRRIPMDPENDCHKSPQSSTQNLSSWTYTQTCRFCNGWQPKVRPYEPQGHSTRSQRRIYCFATGKLAYYSFHTRANHSVRCWKCVYD